MPISERHRNRKHLGAKNVKSRLFLNRSNGAHIKWRLSTRVSTIHNSTITTIKKTHSFCNPHTFTNWRVLNQAITWGTWYGKNPSGLFCYFIGMSCSMSLFMSLFCEGHVLEALRLKFIKCDVWLCLCDCMNMRVTVHQTFLYQEFIFLRQN